MPATGRGIALEHLLGEDDLMYPNFFILTLGVLNSLSVIFSVSYFFFSCLLLQYGYIIEAILYTSQGTVFMSLQISRNS